MHSWNWDSHLPGLVITWLQTSEQTVSEEISKVHDGARRVKEAPYDMQLSGEAKTLPSERRWCTASAPRRCVLSSATRHWYLLLLLSLGQTHHGLHGSILCGPILLLKLHKGWHWECPNLCQNDYKSNIKAAAPIRKNKSTTFTSHMDQGF